MNLKHRELSHVEILAKKQAQDTKEDQVIYERIFKGVKVFDFKAAKDKKVFVKIVRYTRPVERKDVHKDTGRKRPTTAKKKTK